jgi:hypothetical protein
VEGGGRSSCYAQLSARAPTIVDNAMKEERVPDNGGSRRGGRNPARSVVMAKELQGGGVRGEQGRKVMVVGFLQAADEKDLFGGCLPATSKLGGHVLLAGEHEFSNGEGGHRIFFSGCKFFKGIRVLNFRF